MTLNRSYIERNHASTNRIRALARLNDAELRTPIGEDWSIAILLSHLSFWDRRVLFVLDRTEEEGKIFAHQADAFVNDYSLPLFAAIPPREALRLAIETAEILDNRLETYPPNLLEELYSYNMRWVDRSLHRNEHLDEAEAALRPER
jgi:hypothetical protein